MDLNDDPVKKYCRDFESKHKQNPDYDIFEKKVNEISQLIADFSSEDKAVSAAAVKKAKEMLDSPNTKTKPGSKTPKGSREESGAELLGGDGDEGSDDEDESKVRVSKSKTVINQKAFDKFYEEESPITMTQDEFMKSVEADAKKRFEDKKEKQEVAENYKKIGNKAFQSGEYEAALVQYDKAIDQLRDSPLLYTNRALTLLHLELYDQVLPDCEKALRLDQHNMKAHLYKAKALHGMGEGNQARQYVREIVQQYPKQKQMVENYTKMFLELE